MLTPEDVYQWHLYKDKGGPTFSGSESWRSFLGFLEEKLREYGLADMFRNTWTYDRWFTSEWPDDSGWGLESAGKTVKAAGYGANSGSTGPEGITREMVYYDREAPPTDIADKIVVFTTSSGGRDGRPGPPPQKSVSADTFGQLTQTREFTGILQKGKAAGGLVVFDMSYDRAAGLYTFPAPALHQTPTLYLDRIAGASVVGDARSGKTASIRLTAEVESTETFQLIGYLPGKDYGTKKDQKILLITHTDGPSISQDNGALGLLGIVAHISRIPEAERSKTLMVFLDNRHYMPGAERVFVEQNWFEKNPGAKESIVSVVATEHMGQREYREDGDVFEPTCRPEASLIYTRDNQAHVDLAQKAINDHEWPRAFVQREGGPGVIWYGLGRTAVTWDLPAFALGSNMGAYWATTARIEDFDKDLFCTQVSGMAQLTRELMRPDFT